MCASDGDQRRGFALAVPGFIVISVGLHGSIATATATRSKNYGGKNLARVGDQNGALCNVPRQHVHPLVFRTSFQTRRFTEPEILRSSLAAVILRMKSLKIGDVENFPFLEPPSPRMIADGYQLLAELGAVDDNRNLTAIGWRLAKFPIDPKIARMILAAKQENCLHEILIIASALSVQDPRDRPFEYQTAADEAHRRFQDERSDFMAYLKLWDFFDDLLKHKKSNKKLLAQCRERFLSYRRLREWREIHGQLHVLMTEMGFRPNEAQANYDEIHRALLPGCLAISVSKPRRR